MPIYEYSCQQCQHTLDALQKMSEEPLTDCPACGMPQLKRLISAPRFRLKGAGWYETDFKGDNQRNVLKSDSEPPKSSSDSEKKTDGKADKKDAGKSVDKKITTKEASSSTPKTNSKPD